MAWYHPSSLFDKVFEGSLLIKGGTGVLEFLAGLLLFFVHPSQIHDFVAFITQRERIEDPHDLVANALLGWTNHLNDGVATFLIVYLWIHAAVKLVAVIGILRNQLWAYPFSLITLGLLVLYQVYDIALKHSIGMILLTLFDLFVLWLIWREYGKVRHSSTPPFSGR
ncbi:MAG TPA: DUF2127 domain-containing protein [Candidatus Saccharimonadales bacterium]|nr:DUF2127 domain-containing protein [Candidatus Saccharimonadales bacterium]